MKQAGVAFDRNGSCRFTVWAPLKNSMQLHIVHPTDRTVEMQKDEEGYFECELHDVQPGARYFYKPDGGRDYPDPAAHYQPEGVHGASEVVDHSSFLWNDKEWRVKPFNELVLYELHVGTFTDEGSFEAIIPRLDDLVAVGVNAIELMPVSQFPGNRNWGYDGVAPYAVQNSYGGPEGLKKLVNACHQKGIAVFLDVVYNHLGPEGNYFSEYGPYFTHNYSTPWGDALNFDGDWSDGVRDYFAGNALYWFDQYHIDGLRCDAIHMVFDNGAVHFWEYVHHHVKQLEQKKGASFYLVAESDLNSPKVIREPEQGGYGFNAQWLDDFHHALYTMVDEKGKERYEDYGKIEQLAKGYTDGFVLSGEWVKFRKRKYGTSSAGVAGDKFVVFNQNHDQIGNRVKGERLCLLVNFERLKLAAAGILLSPYVPMLFMGEEYGDQSPFYYFVSHSDPELIKAVQKGRREEFADFGFDVEPPDPQDEATFNDCKLKWNKRAEGKHHVMLQWHKALIELRQSYPALQNFDKRDVRVETNGQDVLILHRASVDGDQQLTCIFNFSDEQVFYEFEAGEKKYGKIIDSKEAKWMSEEMDERSVGEGNEVGKVSAMEEEVEVREVGKTSKANAGSIDSEANDMNEVGVVNESNKVALMDESAHELPKEVMGGERIRLSPLQVVVFGS